MHETKWLDDSLLPDGVLKKNNSGGEMNEHQTHMSEMWPWKAITWMEYGHKMQGVVGYHTETNLGEISHPCCIKAPKENQRLLNIPNSFGGSGGLCGSRGSSLLSSKCHS